MTVRVQEHDFDVNAELAGLTVGQHNVGGLVSFIGLVRDFGDLDSVASMTLEHYPGMTEKILGKIASEAVERWNLSSSLIIHRYGYLEPGDRIVLVAAASEHRVSAFNACEFLVDWLKTKAPFWKLEEGNGNAKWVKARMDDNAASARWSVKK
ncbi:MAG: molybdenum cofactor biosynthesis protein MoaE [Pseudomonadota bacterium]|nr:molybdenum cofactor biosynthesis protein MoaE [Pseudomonadota bacterium]